MQRKIHGLTIECSKGDITRQSDIGVIVNAANKQLKGGGGVDGAIHRAAGPKLVEASRALAPIEAGEAVITPAFDLPNDYVVHCAGPVYSKSQPVAAQLASCYRTAMQLAEQENAESIAFPAISAGIYGYPLDEAADIAVTTVVDCAARAQSLKRVRFVLFSDDALAAFEQALERR
ncbi:O-acetyl-ADP-ribose deacetylase [uncultured Salinisphaera sp.]|jgi:O-acetyl-ADP-ribose deacetylase (regulator of RNase III)|uniref:O-acetyl-ADP-ribose deacetylase n=1 Tax=uncultured Salinisphaera sp. TaxID=359372 RepID=UPI0032B0FE8A